MNDEEKITVNDLFRTTDAMVWSKEFVRLKKEKKLSLEDIDEGLMVAWFANAMAVQEFETERRLLNGKSNGYG